MRSHTPAKSPDENRSAFACAAATAADSVSGTSELVRLTVEVDAPSAMPQAEQTVANSNADRAETKDLIAEG
jgi:hypothetical protein